MPPLVLTSPVPLVQFPAELVEGEPVVRVCYYLRDNRKESGRLATPCAEGQGADSKRVGCRLRRMAGNARAVTTCTYFGRGYYVRECSPLIHFRRGVPT